MIAVQYTDDNLHQALSSLEPEQLDELPFGVVKMKAGGEILYYNTFESNLSGLSREEVTGQNFFVQVAPCTNNFLVRERYETEDLDEVVDYVFTYRMSPTRVKLRMLVSSGIWYLVVHAPEAE